MRKAGYASKRKKVKSVTVMTGWLLRCRGWIDSFKGESVCDKYIERFHKKMAYQAGNEDIAAENELFLLRKEAAGIVLAYKEKKKNLNSINMHKTGDSAEVVRENRRNAASFNAIQTELQAMGQKMIEIDETIDHIETVRNIRLANMHSGKEEKIAAYVSGVRRGKIKNYTPPTSRYDDSARHLCKEKHDALEAQMKEIIADQEV